MSEVMTGAAPAGVMTAPLGPTAAHERIEAIDMLRGFALLGILLVNMAMFNGPLYAMMVDTKLWPGLLDRAAEIAIKVLAQAKFYSLFSFLFGVGFSLILTRAEARGASVGRLYARRLLALLLIGTVHAFLIWMGDILMMYALSGFFLLLFRKRQPKTLLKWAAGLLLIPIVLMAGFTAAIEMGRLNPQASAKIDQSFEEQDALHRRLLNDSLRIYATGSFAEVTQMRVTDVAMMWSWAAFYVPNILGMFLVGLYAGRRGILSNPGEHVPLLRKLQRWGLALGLVGNVVGVTAMEMSNLAVPSPLGVLAMTCIAFGAPSLAACYASTLVLLAQDAKWKTRFAPLAAAGRMALTNYLMQSIVCTTLFYSYGLGFYGKMGPAAGVALTFVIWGLQLPLSAWWLRRYRFGPAEWVWRSLTYGKAQPMRTERTAAAAA